ncbi:MAG: hypothetical protein BA871_04635 [Desulfuromonadales bacterium C00003096]|nr:MAG: hypothetical protein BA871_04635 [Desulfuromonadales bacterium C00003096]
MIQRSHGLVRSIEGEGKGYTRALNLGLAKSDGEWVALFDDDELAAPDWLKELFLFAQERSALCVGGRRELALTQDVLSGLGPVCRALMGEFLQKESTTKCHPKLHPYGGNMLIKRSVFDAVGVFDEAMRTGGCDRDLVLRAMNAGVSMGLTPMAVVQHIIPSQRVTPEHIKWYSLQLGNSIAYIDWRRWGRMKTCMACVARIGQALLVNIPLFLVAYIQRDLPEIQDRKALLWRAVAYSQKTLSLLSSRLFGQDSYFSKLEFRRERESMGKE